MTRDIEELSLAKLPESTKILERAKKVLLSPTVTGPFRNPKAVAFIKEAKGGKVIDYDGNEYVDVTMAYGPLILGHNNPIASDAAKEALKVGAVLAIANESEVRLAELMVEAIPCAERVAFCNTGTEATMHAMRVARAVSGKDKIAKFEGGYHGVHDSALVSGLLSLPEGPSEDPRSVADNPGTPQSVVDNVITLTYKNPGSLDKIRKYKDELAAVIIEPVPSSFTVDMKDFLTELREVTKECGVILIFDEVISGFRLGYGGANHRRRNRLIAAQLHGVDQPVVGPAQRLLGVACVLGRTGPPQQPPHPTEPGDQGQRRCRHRRRPLAQHGTSRGRVHRLLGR